MTDDGVPPGDYRDYAVFGLRVRSNVELPELFPAAGSAAPDVTIETGAIAMVAQREDDGLNQVDGALVLVIPEVARYRIEAGNRITVDAEPGVSERNVRLFLLGSAFGVLLHQRGLLPLHANAIEIDGRAVAFMGESGAGKSTLAAWFHDRGYPVIADDVCVVGFATGMRPHAMPGLPRLRLWAQTLEFMGRAVSDYSPSYAGRDQVQKFDVPIHQRNTGGRNIPLGMVYVLAQGESFSLTRLTGIEAADAVFANTYRGGYVPVTKGEMAHWQSAVALVRTTPVFRMTREWGLARLNSQCALLLDHVRSVEQTAAGA